MSGPSRATTAGRAYLDLRSLARQNRRPVDELLQLYALEAFLDRMTGSKFAEVVSKVIDFADPAIVGSAENRSWNPTAFTWS